MCGLHCRNTYDMIILKSLNIAILYSCSWLNDIMLYFVRNVIQWMNHHVPATYLRAVGAKAVQVLAILKKTQRKRKRLCADHRAGNHKVPVQQINVQRPWNLLGKSGMVLGTYQQKSMLKSMGEGNNTVARLLTIVS